MNKVVRFRRPPMYKDAAPRYVLEALVPRWFVFRYRRLTKEVLELQKLNEPDLKVYLPMVKTHGQSLEQMLRSNRAVVPGIVFVRTSLARIQRGVSLPHCVLMRTHSVPSMPVVVPDGAMRDFQKTASILADNPPVVYSEAFDSKRLNVVTFVDAAGDTRLAFLETSQGMKGGTLIVPIHQEELEKAVYTKPIQTDDIELSPRSLCYKVAVPQEGYSVRRIVRSSKYDLENVAKGIKIAMEALRLIDEGGVIDAGVMSRLEVYLKRYRLAETSVVKFQARIVLMLYMCSIVLRLNEDINYFRTQIEGRIMDDYRHYVDNVRKDNRPTALKKFDSFVETFAKVRTMSDKMKRPTYSFGIREG